MFDANQFGGFMASMLESLNEEYASKDALAVPFLAGPSSSSVSGPIKSATSITANKNLA